jgi:hypothetical protein
MKVTEHPDLARNGLPDTTKSRYDYFRVYRP